MAALLRINGFILLTWLLPSVITAQQTDTLFLRQLLGSGSPVFDTVLHHPAHKEVQILYTRIVRDKKNKPHFKSYSYRLNANHYFYPASTVKLPTAIFALEKINQSGVNGLSKESTMLTDSSYPGQTKVTGDSSAANGLPSIAHYIRKILLVSDNDAYNRLYEFTGRERINARLKELDLKDTRITGRLAIGDKGDSKKHTNPVRFYDNERLVYEQPGAYDEKEYPMVLENTMQGHAYLNNKDSIIQAPFDFSEMNAYSLYDQQMVLRRLIFPEAFPKKQQYKLTAEDYQFLYRYMSMFPNESRFPLYPRPEYYPAFCKFLYYGSDTNSVIDPDIRVFNKIGDSYGYMIDNAYIVDFKNNVEFMLSAVVQSNEDGVYNDNKYEYQTICLPFLRDLGRAIYDYEIKHPGKHKADLSKFKIDYQEH